MVFVADILGLPLAWWLLATLWRGTLVVWVPRRADDAKLSVFGCPSRFAPTDEQQWEALGAGLPGVEARVVSGRNASFRGRQRAVPDR